MLDFTMKSKLLPSCKSSVPSSPERQFFRKTKLNYWTVQHKFIKSKVVPSCIIRFTHNPACIAVLSRILPLKWSVPPSLVVAFSSRFPPPNLIKLRFLSYECNNRESRGEGKIQPPQSILSLGNKLCCTHTHTHTQLSQLSCHYFW